MSVQNEINRIEQNVENTYTVLEALGAEMPSERTSDNLAPTAGSAKAVLYKEQTLTDAQKTQARTNIGAASAAEVGKLSDQIADLKENGTGTTVTGGSVKTILGNMMTIMRAQVNPDGTPQVYNPDISAIADMTDELIAKLGTSEEEPDEPINPDVTLSSISVIYTGGSVPVGTALSSLKGITVTAIYSDGSTVIVTGYTLNGEIVEGSNTITVSYGGKTTTFTVTGVAESENVNVTQNGSTLTIIDVPNVTQNGTTLAIA